MNKNNKLNKLINLQIKKKGYLEPLRKSSILPPKTLSGIFSNIEIIQRFFFNLFI